MQVARTGLAGRHAGRRAVSTGSVTTLSQVIFLAGPMLSMIDSSVVNVAVPVIVTSLHTTLSAASWVVSGYLLGLGGGLAATPWLARRCGTLRAYTAVLAGFTLASACCALAPTVGVLIAARVAQGLVAAPMVPLAMGRLVSGSEARRNIPASFGIVFFAAPALGPALGGLLIGQFGWRSVFLINLPVGWPRWPASCWPSGPSAVSRTPQPGLRTGGPAWTSGACCCSAPGWRWPPTVPARGRPTAGSPPGPRPPGWPGWR